MLRRIAAASLLTLAAVAFGPVVACGTDPVGVQSCKDIEHARCENAPACGLSLSTPAHVGTGAVEDVAACERFYDDACLHGFVAPNDPGPTAVQACIAAINTGSCSVVQTPQTAPACAFLANGTTDAGTDAADADADAYN
jgi:hypothetical protein